MNSKKKTLITITAFLGIGLVWLVLVILPFFGQIRAGSEDFILERKKMASLVWEKQELERARQALLKHQEELARIDDLFIDSENPIVFIGFLEEQAKKSQIHFELSSLGPEKDKGPWPSFQFQISAAGSSPDFLKFLERLEASPYLIEVLNLNIGRLSESELAREKFQDLTLADIKASILIRVFTE